MNKLHKLLILKQLYSRKACSETFCDSVDLQNIAQGINAKKVQTIGTTIQECQACRLAKYTKIRTAGHLGAKTKICFITKTPMIESQNYVQDFSQNLQKSQNQKIQNAQNRNFQNLAPIFLQSNSAQMLESIIKKVFFLDSENFSMLWLVKCHTHEQAMAKEINECISFLRTEFEKINPKITIIFGSECAKYMLGSGFDSELGRVLWHNDKAFLITYHLSELVRNPSLKPQALQHFKTAIRFLQ